MGFGPRLALCCGMALSASACVVTSEHQFSQEGQVPPAIVDVIGADFRIADRIEWDREPGLTQGLTFEVVVRDPNLDDQLFARWRIVGTRPTDTALLSTCNPETGEDPVIPPTATAERPFQFTVSPGQLVAGCFYLELAVSDEFNNTCDEVERIPGVFASVSPLGNVGVARWGLIVDPPPGNESPECPTTEVEVSELQATP